MTAKHTPGPWFARRNGTTDPTGTATEWQSWTVHATALPTVAALDETDYGPAATAANARLIAASPELLAVCEAVAVERCRCSSVALMNGIIGCLPCHARAAVRKATDN